MNIKTWVKGTETVPAVDGRELHKALGIGRDFPTWILSRIRGYGFVEGEDYCSYLVVRGSGTPAKEYLLSLNMAGELCLLERTDTGRDLRRYIVDQQSVQNQLENVGNCTEEKPMWELSLEDPQHNNTLKACPRCKAPHQNQGELCQACINFDQAKENKAALVRQRNWCDVTENEYIQCLIEREGDTTMTVPGSYGTVVTFRKNKYGHAVARIENPQHRANILKSIFYRSYTPPEA